MATSVSYVTSHPGYVVEQHSLRRGPGVTIDWANVASGFIDAATGKKKLPGGTVLGTALSGNSKASPRVVTTNPAVCILLEPAYEGSDILPNQYGVLTGGGLYENLLPDATGGPPATLANAVKTELANAGCAFYFHKYSDTR